MKIFSTLVTKSLFIFHTIWVNFWYHTYVEKAESSLSKNWTRMENMNHTYPIDYFFKRRILKLGSYVMFETIRVIKYPEDIDFYVITNTTSTKSKYRAHLFYTRAFGMKKSKANRFEMILYNVLNFLFSKREEVFEVTSSEYMEKYPFVVDIFKDYSRNKKLEQLGL